MGSCLRSLGCLVLIVFLGAVAWLFRGQWEPAVKRFAGGSPSAEQAAAHWEPISALGSSRARDAIDRLGARSGPVFANVAPGDFASYVFDALTRELPSSASDVEAAAIGEQLAMRAEVRLSDFGGPAAFGPVAGVLSDREPVEFTGALAITEPGLAEFRVTNIRIKDLVVPSAMIPNLVGRMGREARPPGASPNGLPFAVPRYIADVRVHDGKITLYKTLP
ncbi:MAG TPA: hypothetical protein VLD17_17740 [Gemmatimonadaceae bacterium]|nr:hypothetical protein [Gemmatimonadaceae bacterium]